MAAALDHIVIAAANLEQGAEFVGDLLGVTLEAGGEHVFQGTHNRLLRLGEDRYLEVIAINPEAPCPDHPRWFELDRPEMRLRIEQRPQLITWAANVSAIEALEKIQAYETLGIHDLARGDLKWRAALTEDGRMPGGGALPLVIQWLVDRPPPYRMPYSGCDLRDLSLVHPEPAMISEALEAMGFDRPIPVRFGEDPGLAVALDCPNGHVSLSSRSSLP